MNERDRQDRLAGDASRYITVVLDGGPSDGEVLRRAAVLAQEHRAKVLLLAPKQAWPHWRYSSMWGLGSLAWGLPWWPTDDESTAEVLRAAAASLPQDVGVVIRGLDDPRRAREVAHSMGSHVVLGLPVPSRSSDGEGTATAD